MVPKIKERDEFDMSETTIKAIYGRQVWDSRGRPTVEAEVHLTSGLFGRAIAPVGASVGSAEAVDLRDGGSRMEGYGVERAVCHINSEIAGCLRGFEATDQISIDQALVALDGTANKSRLGANAMIAVSMAAAHAAAAGVREPLFRYLGGSTATILPMPEIQIFGGGIHARRRVDIQDFMMVPGSAQSFSEALRIASEVYHSAEKLMEKLGKLRGVADEGGFWPEFDTNEEALESLVRAIEAAGYIPGKDVALSLDIAASQFYHSGRYRLGVEGKEYDSDGLGDLLVGWLDRFPILAIEDPMAEEDTEGFRRLTASVGHRVHVVGDDLLVTNAARIEAACESSLCNAALIKPNQAGTLTETKAAFDAGIRAGWLVITSARSGETEDVTIVHLGVGWGAGFLKVGSFARSERMAKWNEALRIETTLGSAGHLAGIKAPVLQGNPKRG